VKRRQRINGKHNGTEQDPFNGSRLWERDHGNRNQQETYSATVEDEPELTNERKKRWKRLMASRKKKRSDTS
jgi:hypothetical protein